MSNVTITPNGVRTCRTCGFSDCSAIYGGFCPRWATGETKPVRVIYDVMAEDRKDQVRNCADCFFHFEDGTVTLCREHEQQAIMDVFNRL